MCILAFKQFKPTLVVTQNKMMNLKNEWMNEKPEREHNVSFKFE